MSRERGFAKVGPKRYQILKEIGNRTFSGDLWSYSKRVKMEYLCVCDQTIHDQTTDAYPSVMVIARTRDQISNNERISSILIASDGSVLDFDPKLPELLYYPKGIQMKAIMLILDAQIIAQKFKNIDLGDHFPEEPQH